MRPKSIKFLYLHDSKIQVDNSIPLSTFERHFQDCSFHFLGVYPCFGFMSFPLSCIASTSSYSTVPAPVKTQPWAFPLLLLEVFPLPLAVVLSRRTFPLMSSRVRLHVHWFFGASPHWRSSSFGRSLSCGHIVPGSWPAGLTPWTAYLLQLNHYLKTLIT